MPEPERTESWEGSCACGQVRYRALGPLIDMVHCHCTTCRKRHAAAFATHVGVRKEQFAFVRGEALLQTCVTRGHVRRRFCGTCGSQIYSESPQWAEIYFTAGTLDTPLAGLKQLHIFVRSKVPWHDIADEHPRHEAYPEDWSE